MPTTAASSSSKYTDDQLTSQQNNPNHKKRANPSKVHLYAEFLGVDLKRHSYLYDLMEEGMRCPLPEGWKIRQLEPDDDGAPVYEFYHEPSGKISNAHPMDEVFLERAQAVIRKHEAVVSARREREGEQKQQQLSTTMWSSDDDSADDNNKAGRNSNHNNKKQKSASPTYRKPSSPGAKKFRYLLYCFAFAAMLHFVAYRAVYSVMFESGMNTALAKQQKERPTTRSSGVAVDQQQPQKSAEHEDDTSSSNKDQTNDL